MSKWINFTGSKKTIYINAFLFGMTSISLVTNIVLVNQNQSHMAKLAVFEQSSEETTGFVLNTTPPISKVSIDPTTGRQVLELPLVIDTSTPGLEIARLQPIGPILPSVNGKKTHKIVPKIQPNLVENTITATAAQKMVHLSASVVTSTHKNEKNKDKPVVSKKTQKPKDELTNIAIIVRRGDSLSRIFYRAGLTDRDVYEVGRALKKAKKRLTIHPNNKFEFILDKDNDLLELRRQINILNAIVVKKVKGKYIVSKETKVPVIKVTSKTVIINNNLSYDSKRAGLALPLSMELADIFGWEIDFALDIRKGDSFTIFYEEKFVDNHKIGLGNIIAAKFINKGKEFTAIRYIDKKGNASFYTKKGLSMRKAFIRSPVAFNRISSNFQKSRYHPVLKRLRAHKGTDYAAKPGTPIKASGNGKIIWRGKKGAYGNTIIIRHAGKYTTLYAHMSKFKRGFRTGSSVEQGQVIGYVGATGRVTGPHLHYEFRINGVHKDPMKVKLPNDAPLSRSETKKFKKYAAKWISKLKVKV